MQYVRSIDDLDRLRSLSGTKWTRHGPDVLPAWVADMDLEPAPAIRRAIHDMVDRGDLGYQTELRELLVPAWLRWIDQRHGLSLPESEIWPFAGVLHGLETALMLYTRPGDGVALFTPVYFPFGAAIRDSGRRLVDVPLGDRWRLDVDRFAATIDDTTRAVLFSQPHNPIGRVFSAEEIRAFADIVVEHDLLVISDEIWADLPHPPNRHLPLVQADERLLDHTITLGSATKAFNMSGLRCALGHVGHPEVREQLQALPCHLPAGPSTLSIAASIAAWAEGVEWLEVTGRTLTARRDHLAQRLADEVPEVGFDPPEATYLAWLDLRRTSLGPDPAAALIDRAGVALSPGIDFGEQGVGCARLNFATTESILDEIIDRIVRAIRSGPD